MRNPQTYQSAHQGQYSIDIYFEAFCFHFNQNQIPKVSCTPEYMQFNCDNVYQSQPHKYHFENSFYDS